MEPLAQKGHEERAASRLQILSGTVSAYLDGNRSILPELQLLWAGHLPLFKCFGIKLKATFLGRDDKVKENSYYLRKEVTRDSEEPSSSL